MQVLAFRPLQYFHWRATGSVCKSAYILVQDFHVFSFITMLYEFVANIQFLLGLFLKLSDVWYLESTKCFFSMCKPSWHHKKSCDQLLSGSLLSPILTHHIAAEKKNYGYMQWNSNAAHLFP